MSDPSLLVGIWNYMFAVVWQWWGIIALVLGLMRVAPMVFPASMGWVEWLQRERQVFLSLAIALFVIANFQLYDQCQREIRALKWSPFDASKLDISKLPTSPEGLHPGQVWNNGGVISIAQ
jgi:hypothetical protein